MALGGERFGVPLAEIGRGIGQVNAQRGTDRDLETVLGFYFPFAVGAASGLRD